MPNTRLGYTARRGTGRRQRHGALPLPLAALLLVLSACNVDKLLEVEDPDVARPEALRGKEALPALQAGALSDFQVGYSGSSNLDGQVTLVGLLTDELYNSESFPTRIEVDQRRMRDDNGTLRGAFLNMQRARAAAERAVRRYEEFDPGILAHAHMLNIAGFSYVTFGENYCSGVPFSTLNDDGTITFGEQQTTTQMFQTAVSSFDAALGILAPLTTPAAGIATQRNLAAVGKGRALLNLGQHGAAATAVANVPVTFRYLIEHSTNSARQQNPVFTLVNVSRRFSVPDREGTNGLPFRSAGDPRVPVVRNPVNPIGLDNETPSWIQLKYPARDSDIPLATGIEAELIKAEAAMRGNDFAAALLILNNLRATQAPTGTTLTPLADPGTEAGRVNLLFSERAFWLYLTAHRLGDMRRLARPVADGGYGRSIESVFPTGQYHKSGSLPYGTDVNFPLPDDERNNPKVAAPECLNRSP